MADSGLNHLNQDPYDQNTADLVQRLFLAKDGQDVNDRPRMEKVKSIFRSIRRNYRTEVFGDVHIHDVVIYCDDSRWVKTDKRDLLGRPLFRDTITGSLIVYNNQQCHEASLVGKVALAVTWNAFKNVQSYNPQTGVSETRPQEFPTQIQLCAWFIDWIKSKEYKLGDQVARTRIGRKVVKKAEGNKFLRQIDAFSLLDKVLLHEMTHGKAAWFGYAGKYYYKGTDDAR
ncbi:hypothetical protein CC80DRAFT_416825 [Byssothecium circinans]|uniref:Uncharacterized protein n=1 Tax=Byssothecium circinans TaxID=147558 RepID=A0A6A5TPH5_9PLEO|nr:hypothetical protein CC80DRAFT_416825 [Byssothecium circinans]